MTAIWSAIIAGACSIICALITRSKGPATTPAQAMAGEPTWPWSPARWLSWVAMGAWIIPLAGFPFSLITLGFALRDRSPEVGRRVPAYAIPVAIISLILTILNAIWGGWQAAHGCQFWQGGTCHY